LATLFVFHYKWVLLKGVVYRKYLTITIKGKVISMLNEDMGEWTYSSTILDLGSRWR
jgi:hypothetical protein